MDLHISVPCIYIILFSSKRSVHPFPAHEMSLPVEVLEQILSRLPVKYLMQLKCVCKYWLLLISSNKQFTKQYLQMLIQCHHLITPGLMDYPLSFVLTTVTNGPPVQLHPLNNQSPYHRLVGSCDGIICIAIDNSFALLWNLSIRKFKLLPDLQNPHPERISFTVYGFGYHHLTDTYKVVVSLHLGTESYGQILQPNYGDVVDLDKSLSVLRDRLSIVAHCSNFVDIWVMKEYGVTESWTKLFSVPTTDIATQFGNNLYRNARALYVSEDSKDEQVILELFSRLFVYNSSDGTFKTPEIERLQNNTMFQRDNACLVPTVYVESLISPSD